MNAFTQPTEGREREKAAHLFKMHRDRGERCGKYQEQEEEEEDEENCCLL